MKYFESFAGIRGFAKGIEQAYANFTHEQIGQCGDAQQGCGVTGGREPQLPSCVGYSEIDRFANAVSRFNYPEQKNYGDAAKLISDELPDFDFYVGGFPCQAFSIAGKRAGFDDARGTLFFEIARILRDKRPRYFLLENVKGLLSHDGGKTMQSILGILADLDYFVETIVLNSKDFGVPQNRERVFFIGSPGDGSCGEILSFGCSDDGVTKNGNENGQAFALDANYYKGADGKRTMINELTQIGHLSSNAEAHRVYDSDGLARTIKNGGGMGAKTGLYAINNERHGSRIYDGESGIVATLTANAKGGTKNERYKLGQRIRRLTPTECERLQGFLPGWTKYGIDEKGNKIEISDSARYKMLGNAVTTNVITALITRMLEVGWFAE